MTDAFALISQRRWGRIAGAALMLIILSGLLGNDLIVSGDARTTASNIFAHETRFRVGIGGELLMLNSDILLAVALYALLKPVDANLALLGAFWRLANAVLMAAGVVASLVAVDLVRDAHYLEQFSVDQRLPLTAQLLDIHGTMMLIGLFLFSLGAATHSYLLLRSRYIPRFLSGAYLIFAVVLFIGSFAIILFPHLDALIDPWFILPDFAIELLVALWLLIKGADVAASIVVHSRG
jgi:hypothetical protein